MLQLARSGLDLRTCSVADLETILGIGMKTARFFILHTRPNAQVACLDTHILHWLAYYNDVPKQTPAKRYLQQILISRFGVSSEGRMRNHWIEQYRLKGQRWWTAEFIQNGKWALKCRRVELGDDRAPPTVGYGDLDMIFRNVTPQDRELIDFLNNASRGMKDVRTIIRRNRGIYPILMELERYELERLFYRSACVGSTMDALKFTFGFYVFQHTII